MKNFQSKRIENQVPRSYAKQLILNQTSKHYPTKRERFTTSFLVIFIPTLILFFWYSLLAA